MPVQSYVWAPLIRLLPDGVDAVRSWAGVGRENELSLSSFVWKNCGKIKGKAVMSGEETRPQSSHKLQLLVWTLVSQKARTLRQPAPYARRGEC